MTKFSTKDMLHALDFDIARREGELESLRQARDVYAGSAAQQPDTKPPRLMLPAPEPKPRKGGRRKKTATSERAPPAKAPQVERFEIEINGSTIALSERLAELFNRLNEEPEASCVSVETLTALHGGGVGKTYADLRMLRELLAPAKATIGTVRGEGYRLENL